MATDNDDRKNLVKVFFIPFCSAGHAIPMVDTAILLARHGGVDATIVATPANARLFHRSIDRESSAGRPIRLHTLPFPAAEAGLPSGIESAQSARSLDDFGKVFHAFLVILRPPMERLFRGARPDCIVSDAFFAWTGCLAAELGFPRLVFHSSSYVGHCGDLCAVRRQYDVVAGDVLALRGLPDKMEMLRSQLPDWVETPGRVADLLGSILEYSRSSDGAIVNSFTELERRYEEWFVRTHGIRAWSVGPTMLLVDANGYNSSVSSDENQEVLKWLTSKENGSVVYVSFGSNGKLQQTQLFELACSLEACGHPFVWLVSSIESNRGAEGALPEGFEERKKRDGTGFVIHGWAPQKLILRHPAVGGFVTHCGWNSVLESISSGKPMMTWPLSAEQFYNEKLLVDVLGVAVAVGATEWKSNSYTERKELVRRDRIIEAVAAVMGGGDGAVEMRKRARKLADAAKMAVESGGSSHANLTELINELKSKKIQKELQVKAVILAPKK